MTNKRASEILYDQWQRFLEENLDYGGVSEAYKKAFKALDQEPVYYPPCIDCNKKMNEIRNAYDNITTKALAQESIINKIRAEIEQVAEEESKVDKKWAKGLKYALKIIDKHRTENEE